MSMYSITENNYPFNPKSSNYLNFQKLAKLNKFYNTKSNFSSKFNPLYITSNKEQNRQNIFISDAPFTPIKMAKTKSLINLSNTKYLNSTTKTYKNLSHLTNITNKIKNKFNPDILDTQFISKPKKLKKKKISIDVPRYNTFLNNKIKTKSLHLTKFDLINGNVYNLVTSTLMNKPVINKSIREIEIKSRINNNYNNDPISHSMKVLIERSNKSNKKAAAFMINKFKQKLIYEKKENLNEYNKFMSELKANLSRSKSKSRPKKKFFYD